MRLAKIIVLTIVLSLGAAISIFIYTVGVQTGFSEGQRQIQDFCNDELIFRFKEGGNRYYCISEKNIKRKPKRTM